MNAEATTLTGTLVIVATPIGNLNDFSPRAVQTLNDADVIACEDTRHTGRLLAYASIDTPKLALHDHNEADQAAVLVERLRRGETIALVSDAGTPTISDPGYRVVRAARDAGVTVTAVPGPSAVLHALAVAGLPTDRWAFEGFLPRKTAARRQRLGAVSADDRTLVFYLSPHRAADDLAAMAEVFGADRPAVLCRELTKLHEESIDGTLETLFQHCTEQQLKGEITLVVAGHAKLDAGPPSTGQLVERVAVLMDSGLSKRDAVRQVADETGVSKRTVYDAVT